MDPIFFLGLVNVKMFIFRATPLSKTVLNHFIRTFQKVNFLCSMLFVTAFQSFWENLFTMRFENATSKLIVPIRECLNYFIIIMSYSYSNGVMVITVCLYESYM